MNTGELFEVLALLADLFAWGVLLFAVVFVAVFAGASYYYKHQSEAEARPIRSRYQPPTRGIRMAQNPRED